MRKVLEWTARQEFCAVAHKALSSKNRLAMTGYVLRTNSTRGSVADGYSPECVEGYFGTTLGVGTRR